MIISIWRYSHLALAVSSFVFILIVSITGIILAFEPISEQIKPYEFDLEKYNIARTIDVMQQEYHEIISLERNHNNFVVADVITKNGENQQFYINPSTGKKVGDLIEKAQIYNLMTNIHRSLFLKSTGRAIIGIVSFLLFLIVVTGTILIAKRQGGFSKLLSKVVKEDTHQYYHVVLSRYSFIPIIILTITGIYLSLEKFSLLPKEEINHEYEFTKNTSGIQLLPKDYPVFQTISLSEIKKIEFPFSNDSEDYFLVDLKSKELIIEQYTGTVLSAVDHPFVSLASSISMKLHTGRGSIIWSILILLATSSILYFIYSGFAMTLARRKKNTFLPKNLYTANEAEYIILVGSETGGTYKPAKWVFDSILKNEKKVFITEMNKYVKFPKMKELLVFTSTYGTGEAPSNANYFLEKLSKVKVENKVNYSVVGFGSLAYPDFCEFAIKVDTVLSSVNNFNPSIALYKIHNQSISEFNKWCSEWSSKANLSEEIEINLNDIKIPKQIDFEVVKRSCINNDQTFTLQLRPKKKVKFASGDLLVLYPQTDKLARHYSIARIDDEILLSIKRHKYGVCSQQLSTSNQGDIISATIEENKEFHLSKKTRDLIFISNGTGIAPFLGILKERKPNQSIHFFWGGRTKESFKLYKKYIETDSVNNIHIAYSQDENQCYVQDLIKVQSELITSALKNQGEIMICGSLAMEKGVKEELHKITLNHLQSELSDFQNQIKSDCY